MVNTPPRSPQSHRFTFSRSPMKISLEPASNDPARTPARRVPVTESLRASHFSLNGPHTPSFGQSSLRIHTPVFTRPATDNPNRSPARRIPITEAMGMIRHDEGPSSVPQGRTSPRPRSRTTPADPHIHMPRPRPGKSSSIQLFQLQPPVEPGTIFSNVQRPHSSQTTLLAPSTSPKRSRSPSPSHGVLHETLPPPSTVPDKSDGSSLSSDGQDTHIPLDAPFNPSPAVHPTTTDHPSMKKVKPTDYGSRIPRIGANESAAKVSKLPVRTASKPSGSFRVSGPATPFCA